MDLNSPLFDSIRIKPTCDDGKSGAGKSGGGKSGLGKSGVGKLGGASSTGEQLCETPGCTQSGLYRDPKVRKQ